MHPDAGLEPHIDARCLVVEMATAETDERDREIANLPLGRAPPVHRLGAAPPVDEQP